MSELKDNSMVVIGILIQRLGGKVRLTESEILHADDVVLFSKWDGGDFVILAASKNENS